MNGSPLPALTPLPTELIAFAEPRWRSSTSERATFERASFCSGTRSWRAPSATSALRSTMPSSCPSKLTSDGRSEPRRPNAAAINRFSDQRR